MQNPSDWHGLILGGRALDCAGRMGLGLRPGPETHVLDTRKDRAYAFEARLSSLDGPTSREPGGEDREFLRFDGEESLELAPGDGVLVPVRRDADGSLSEIVLPVECSVEAVQPRKGSSSLLQLRKTRVFSRETWSQRWCR